MGDDCCDENSALDWALLGLAIAASVPFILANAAILRHRQRRFFQLQGGAMLILGGSFAGIVWIMSSFIVNGHFNRSHSRILGACNLWTFWLHGTLGPCLWFSCISLRLYNVVHFYSSRRVFSSWKYLLLSLLPAISLSVVTIPLRAYVHGARDCKLNLTFEILAWVILVAPYLCLYLVLLFRLRSRVTQSDPILVTEYVHTCEFMFMACVILLLTGITYLTEGQMHPEGRVFLTFCECCLVFSHFWLRLGWPVYLCLFRPESEMDDFENELRLPGGRSLDLMHAVYSQRSHNFTSSEGAVLEAVSKAVEDVDRYKAKIRELEQLKASLLVKLSERLLTC